MIRVGRCEYNNNMRTDPSYPNFTTILVLMNSHSEWGVLGPYLLKDGNNRIMENIWQFSKVYESVPATTQKYSRWNNKIIWQHPHEVHYTQDKLLPAYWNWRTKGMNNQYAVRYPVGYGNMHTCKFAIAESDPNEKLGYIEARKKIYVPLYCNLVKQHNKFDELKQRLKNGENLLIVEVDGPHQESLQYYKQKYNVNDSFINDNSMLVTPENLYIMLNDDKHAFGHGYCLAIALLDMEDEIINKI